MKQEPECKGRRDSALVSTGPQRVLLPSPSQESPPALPLPSPPGELGLLNPTRWAGLHGSLLARRHHPNLPRAAPVTSHPRAPAASNCSQRWDAQSLRHLEPGCERKGRPLREPHPRPWNIWVRGGWGFSTPDVVRRPPAVRAPSLGQAAGESGWTRGRGWDFSLLTDLNRGNLKFCSRRGPTNSHTLGLTGLT